MSCFTESFKRINRSFLFTVMFDVMQYVILSLIVIGSVMGFYKLYVPLFDVQMTAEEINQYIMQHHELPPLSGELSAGMESGVDAVQGFIVKMVLLAIVSYILFMLCSALLRSLVYSRLRKVKYNPGYFLRFLKYNSLWLGFWALIMVLSFSLFRPGVTVYLFLIEIALFLHLSMILRYFIAEKSRFRQIAVRFYQVGIKKSYRFIIPVLVILLFFFLVNQIPWLEAILPHSLVLLILLIVFFIFMSWTRLYYAVVIEGAK